MGVLLGNSYPLDYFNTEVCKFYLKCKYMGTRKCLKCKNFHPPKQKEAKKSYFKPDMKDFDNPRVKIDYIETW